jgi:hypothetical protein
MLMSNYTLCKQTLMFSTSVANGLSVYIWVQLSICGDLTEIKKYFA